MTSFRSATRTGSHPQTYRMHSRKYAHAAETCDLIVVNSEFTGG